MHRDQGKRPARQTWQTAALAAFLPLLSGQAKAQEIVAVLSADIGPYRQAYESFQEAFGKAVPVLPLERYMRLPKGARVVVAFGGKAAGKRYPDEVTLIYGVAPGLEVGLESHDGKSIRIPMEPEASTLLSSLIMIQPRLKTLAVVWSSDALASYVRTLEAAGQALSIAIDSERLDDPAELPATLRKINGRVNALWLPADPLLVNAESFETIKRYAYSTGIPLYAPTEGLAEAGAAAAVSVGNEEIGRTAAKAAKGVLTGGNVPGDAYAEHSMISINLAAAKATGISIPAEAIKKAARVFP